MFSLSRGVFFLPTAEVGQFSVEVGQNALKGRDTATTVTSALSGCLLIDHLSQNGPVGLQLSNTNLGSRLNR
jgi:hypothetical protein